MNHDGTGFRQLTNSAPNERVLSASYSPDGTRITFARDGIAGLPDVSTIRTNGRDVRRRATRPVTASIYRDPRKASRTCGSNCRPDCPVISAIASDALHAALYGRV